MIIDKILLLFFFTYVFLCNICLNALKINIHECHCNQTNISVTNLNGKTFLCFLLLVHPFDIRKKMTSKRLCDVKAPIREYGLKETKKGLHIPECAITENKYNQRFRPHCPIVEETIQIQNKKNVRFLTDIPTINEIELYDKPYGQVLNNTKRFFQKTKYTLVDDQQSNINTNVTESKLFMKKKKNEQDERKKLNVLEKGWLAEKQLITLDQLQKYKREQMQKIKNTSKFSKLSKIINTIPQEKKSQSHGVIKFEDFLSKLQLNNDDYQLLDNSLLDNLTPKIVDVDNSLVQTHNNEKLIEEKNGKQKGYGADMSGINLSTQLIDTKTYMDLQLCKEHKEILKNIHHLVELQELLYNRCLPSKNYHSKSTQTNDCNDLLPLFSLRESPSTINYISVLKCKHTQLTKQNDFDFHKPADNLKSNEYSISNNLNTNKINIINNDKYNVQHLPNVNDKELRNDFNKYKSSLIKETIVSELNDLTLNETSTNNICEEQKNAIANDNMKKVLKKPTWDLDLLIKDNCQDTNDLHSTSTYSKFDKKIKKKSSFYFPEIHHEFQTELKILDQLNQSLCDIENMSCDMSIEPNKQHIDNEFNDQSSFNVLNFKTLLNTSYKNNDILTQSIKLKVLSSNMMCVDKTNRFCIQMFEQLIKDEEHWAKQHHIILFLMMNTLTNRLKWENTMCDLQTQILKNRPGYEKKLQLFQQKHRGNIKKLEHSLYQVKHIGREIESFYAQQIIILKAHVQYLRKQSSLKKVIHTLKNLNRVPKRFNRINLVGTVESECVNMNSTEFIGTSENNKISPATCEVDKSKIILQTSSINIDTEPIENVNIQTKIKESLQFAKNKFVQTSKPLNTKSTNSPYKYESFDATMDKPLLSSILPISHAKLMRTTESTNSEQIDIDVRISTLQVQLEARMLELFRLKKEQTKLKLDNLKAIEHNILKQIDLYDKNIEESKKSLTVETERKSVLQVKQCSLKLDSPSKYFSQKIKNNENDHTLEVNSRHLHASHKQMWADGHKYSYPIAAEKSNNHIVTSEDKQNVAIITKLNFNKYKNNCNSVQNSSEGKTEGNITLEDKTFIRQYPNDSNLEQNGISTENRVDVVTNNIPIYLNNMDKTLMFNTSKPLFPSEKNDINNLIEGTQLMTNLKGEEKQKNTISLSQQATTISDVLLKCHLQQIVSETLQMYLPKLNENKKKNLSLYLNWSSSRKRVKLLKCLNIRK